MNTKTLNTYEKLWLANRASHNMALAGLGPPGSPTPDYILKLECSGVMQIIAIIWLFLTVY